MAGRNNWDGDLHLTSDAITLEVRELPGKTLLGVTKAALEKIKQSKRSKSIKEALRAITGDPIRYKIRWVLSKQGRTKPREGTPRDTLDWPAVELREDGRPGHYAIGDATRARELKSWLMRVTQPSIQAESLTLPVQVLARTSKDALYEVYIFVRGASTKDEKEERPFIELLNIFEYGEARDYPTFSSTTPIRERLEDMVLQAREAIWNFLDPLRGPGYRRGSVVAFLFEPSEDERSDPLSMVEIDVSDNREPQRGEGPRERQGGAMRRGNWAILGRVKKSRRSPTSQTLPLIAFWYSQDDDDDENMGEALKNQVAAISSGARKVRIDRLRSTSTQPEGPTAADPASLQRARELKQAYLNFRDALRRIKHALSRYVDDFFRRANEATFLSICEQDEEYSKLYNYAVLFAEDPNEVVYQTARTLIRCLQLSSAAGVRAARRSSSAQLKKLGQEETRKNKPEEALKGRIFQYRKREKARPPVDPEVAENTKSLELLADLSVLRKIRDGLKEDQNTALKNDPQNHAYLFQVGFQGSGAPPADSENPVVRLQREISNIEKEIESIEKEVDKRLPRSL